MTIINIKGNDLNIVPMKDSSYRRATHLKNKMIEIMGKIGLTEDDIDFSDVKIPMKKAAAYISWYANGMHCHFSYNKERRHIDNLNVVAKLIEAEIAKVVTNEKELDKFLADFEEDVNISEKRQKAREYFGLDEHHDDLNSINKAYKKLSKTHHPDMPEGNDEKFKELNEHHKILKKELEH